MRKLTVKNFSVIKDAELEFGKITVLIGPQSSGKSLLCKLAYFLSKEILEHAAGSILRGVTFGEFKSAIIGKFLKRFSAGFTESPYVVEFSERLYSIKFYGQDGFPGGDIGCIFSEHFENLYTKLRSKIYVNAEIGGNPILRAEDVVWTELNLLLTDPVILRSRYIPAGRAFFTNASMGIKVLRNPDIDPLVGDFAEMIKWNTPRLSHLPEQSQLIAARIQTKILEIARGHVVGTSDSPVFMSEHNRPIPFTLLSSGTQELLPLFNVLGQLVWDREGRVIFTEPEEGQQVQRWPVWTKDLVYLEEPEAHIFPETQYELIRLFAWLSNEQTQDFSWVITTHSPYILTAFNSLIEAWRVGNKVGKREHVAALIPEQYWVNENDFAAYSIRDGRLESIFKKETEGEEGSGLIDGNFLDSVSDSLGSEFDKLLDIEYAD